MVVNSLTGKLYVAFANGVISAFPPTTAVALTSLSGAGVEREARAIDGSIEEPKVKNCSAQSATSQNHEKTRQGGTCGNEYVPIDPPPGEPSTPASTPPNPGATIPSPDPTKPCESIVTSCDAHGSSVVDTCTGQSTLVLTGACPGDNEGNMQPPPPSCSTDASGPTSPVSSTGGGGTVAVTAGSCRWSARSLETWIDLSGGPFPKIAFGTGSVGLAFTAKPNPATTERTGVIQIEGRDVFIRQAAGSSVGVRRPPDSKVPSPKVNPRRDPGSGTPVTPVTPRRQ
jgi:hypothetical protein